MPKEKKIGINFFLNERLKPSRFNGENVYPVYAQITFDRKNHQCPAPIGYLSKAQFEQKIERGESADFKGILQEFEDKIKAIVTEEYKYFGERFTFKGFSKRLRKYDEPLIEILDKSTKAAIIQALRSELKKEELKALKFDLFTVWDTYDIIRKNFLSPFEKVLNDQLTIELAGFVYLSGFLGKRKDLKADDSEFLRVIDWFLLDVANEFKSFLIQYAPIDAEDKKRSLGFFTDEAKGSPVWDLLFSLNITFVDIPLIIKSLEKKLIL